MKNLFMNVFRIIIFIIYNWILSTTHVKKLMILLLFFNHLAKLFRFPTFFNTLNKRFHKSFLTTLLPPLEMIYLCVVFYAKRNHLSTCQIYKIASCVQGYQLLSHEASFLTCLPQKTHILRR